MDSVEPACANLLICVHLRNSDGRGRQHPAARSIGLYWEGQMGRLGVRQGDLEGRRSEGVCQKAHRGSEAHGHRGGQGVGRRIEF